MRWLVGPGDGGRGRDEEGAKGGETGREGVSL